MLKVFSEMNHVYLFTSGFDSRIIEARDAIRALKRTNDISRLTKEKA